MLMSMLKSILISLLLFLWRSLQLPIDPIWQSIVSNRLCKRGVCASTSQIRLLQVTLLHANIALAFDTPISSLVNRNQWIARLELWVRVAKDVKVGFVALFLQQQVINGALIGHCNAIAKQLVIRAGYH